MEPLGETSDVSVWGKVVFDDCGKASPVSNSQKACVVHRANCHPTPTPNAAKEVVGERVQQ